MPAFIPFPSWLKPEILPGLPFRWYGLMYLAAFAVAYLLVKVQVRSEGIEVETDDLTNLFFWGILGLLVGARLLGVTLYDPSGYYLSHPLQIIVPLRRTGGRLVFSGLAGMSFHGGLIGATAAIWIYLKKKRMNVLEWGDRILAAVPLGYTFGRLGNFINGELFGRITPLPWGMIFPQAPEFSTRLPWVKQFAARAGIELAGRAMINLPRHPSQLYEAFLEGIVLWLILWFIIRKASKLKGRIICGYLIGYGSIRFFIEYLREPDAELGFPIQLVALANPTLQWSPLNFTVGQILCFLMIAGGVLGIFLFRRFAACASSPAPGGTGRPSLRKLKKRIH